MDMLIGFIIGFVGMQLFIAWYHPFKLASMFDGKWNEHRQKK